MLKVRFEYLCWKIQAWMGGRTPYAPIFLQIRGVPYDWLPVRYWRRVQRLFRQHTGGRSHRCEFTDRQKGALYGHNYGAFMDDYFNKFVDSLPDD